MAKDPEDELEGLICEISEEAFCAQWQGDIEFDLWDCVTGGKRTVGQMTLSAAQVESLRRLSDAAGGWLWFPRNVPAPTLVPMSEWVERFARWRAHDRRDADPR